MAGIFLRHLLQAIDPEVRQIAVRAGRCISRVVTRRRFSINASRSMIGMAHNSPSFNGRDRLISGDEGAEWFRIDLRVHVRDQFEHDIVNAGQAGGSAVQQARQFPAVTPRQMPPGHLDLLLDQVEIIEQPLRGGSNSPVRIRGQREVVKGAQTALVGVQPCQERVGCFFGGDAVIPG